MGKGPGGSVFMGEDLASESNRSPVISSSSAVINGDLILNSWKEIAAYLGRSVRTVQRMEADLGLPVRRPRGHARTSVTALASELDQWLKSFAPRRKDGFAGVQQKSAPSGPESPRILIVEDHDVTSYALSRLLLSFGYEVSVARSGRDALELAASADIVLLDMNLPEIHGLEVLRRLRTGLHTSHIPVICTSNTYAPEGAAPVALQLGAKRFLTHPISAEVLQAAIQEVMLST